MKRKYFIVSVSFLLIVSSLLLPCSAALSNIDNTLVIDRLYYTSYSDYSDYKLLTQTTHNQGETYDSSQSLGQAVWTPNYFFEQFHIYSSDGLPIAEGGKKWRFTIANVYNYISVDQEQLGGEYFLSKVDEFRIWFTYTDGTESSRYIENSAKYFFSEDMGLCTITFPLAPSRPNADVLRISVQMRFDITDFGLPRFNANTDLYEFIYHIGTNDFMVSRDEVFPSPNGTVINNYENAETQLFDSTAGGRNAVGSVFTSLSSIFSRSSSLYRGVSFVGNLMSDIVEDALPDVDNLITVSLALGIVTIIIGFGAEAVFSRRRSSSGTKSNSKSKNNAKAKGG